MSTTRRGFLWGLFKASAAVAVVPILIKKVAPLPDLSIEWNRQMTKLAEQFDPFIQNTTSLNGKWKWVNVQDAKDSGKIGNFCGTFEIFPKPDPHEYRGMAFLYDAHPLKFKTHELA